MRASKLKIGHVTLTTPLFSGGMLRFDTFKLCAKCNDSS